MAINGGIFGSFLAGGGNPSNTLIFNPGLLAGQVVPSSTAFNPTAILQTFFQPFPYAANSLVTSNQIALAGGGPPLIASYPTMSPFSNAFLNMFNPAASAGLGGLTPGVTGTFNPIGTAGLGGFGSLAGLGGFNSLASLGGFGSQGGFGGFGGGGSFGSLAGLGGINSLNRLGGFGVFG